MDRYSKVHASRCGPGDARPTALQVVSDEQKARCRDSVALHDLVIVITGATSGIGFETAKALYAVGARLFITARDLNKARATVNQVMEAFPSGGARKQSIEIVKVDMNSLSSVRSGAQELLSKADRIDVLINNAGKCPAQQMWLFSAAVPLLIRRQKGLRPFHLGIQTTASSHTGV